MFGASGGNLAASPTAVGSRSRPLAGPIQAGFDHRLLERPPDVRAYAAALPGSIPFYYQKNKQTPSWCLFVFGASGGNRTHNLLITNELLCH